MLKKPIFWVLSALIVFSAFVLYDSFYIVHETQQGVLTHFGKISPPAKQPGFHWKWPRPISKVYKVDRRIQLISDQPHELITEDQKNIQFDGFMLWRVTDPIRFIEAIRTEENALEKIRDLYLSSSGIVVSNRSRDQFVGLGLEHEDHDVAATELLARVAPIALESYGVEVLHAGILEYTMPAENRPAVIERMISERGRIAARYRSEGEEEAIRIESIAMSEHTHILATAHAEATEIMGKAEAEAMAILGEAYREDPEFYKFVRALDSYDLIIDDKTTLMLSADNELFKYLDSNSMPK